MDWIKIILMSFSLYLILEIRKIFKNKKLKTDDTYANFFLNKEE
jgi:hypothetical protein